jgi:hypothetical protein
VLLAGLLAVPAGADSPPASGARTAPALTGLKLRPSQFYDGGFLSGTKIRFELNRATKVTFRVDQLSSGCLATGRRQARCILVKRIGSFSASCPAGLNKRAWNGLVNDKPLKPGTYRLTAFVAATGRGDSAKFKVVPAPIVEVRR